MRMYSTTMAMRDGRRLAADVYLPDRDGRHATILIQTPYHKGQFRAALNDGYANHGLFDRRKYAYVVVD